MSHGGTKKCEKNIKKTFKKTSSGYEKQPNIDNPINYKKKQKQNYVQ